MNTKKYLAQFNYGQPVGFRTCVLNKWIRPASLVFSYRWRRDVRCLFESLQEQHISNIVLEQDWKTKSQSPSRYILDSDIITFWWYGSLESSWTYIYRTCWPTWQLPPCYLEPALWNQFTFCFSFLNFHRPFSNVVNIRFAALGLTIGTLVSKSAPWRMLWIYIQKVDHPMDTTCWRSPRPQIGFRSSTQSYL